MLNELAFFHRTAKGLNEIQHKTHGLTQSERLVLIIVDGVTPCKGLREKLKGLAEGRFESALLSLTNNGLVEERDAPDAEHPVEGLDSGLVDQFLRQDPMDPITITAQNSQIGPDGDEGLSPPAIVEELNLQPGRIRTVDIYLPLEPVIRPADTHSSFDVESPRPMSVAANTTGRLKTEKGNTKQPLLAYWGILAGLILLILVIVLQLSS